MWVSFLYGIINLMRNMCGGAVRRTAQSRVGGLLLLPPESHQSDVGEGLVAQYRVGTGVPDGPQRWRLASSISLLFFKRVRLVVLGIVKDQKGEVCHQGKGDSQASLIPLPLADTSPSWTPPPGLPHPLSAVKFAGIWENVGAISRLCE